MLKYRYNFDRSAPQNNQALQWTGQLVDQVIDEHERCRGIQLTCAGKGSMNNMGQLKGETKKGAPE